MVSIIHLKSMNNESRQKVDAQYNLKNLSVVPQTSYRGITLNLTVGEYLACYRFHRLTGSKFLVSYMTASSYHCSHLRKLFRLLWCCQTALP